MPSLKTLQPIAMFLVITAVVGCSGGNKNLATVTGTVKLDGAPLDTAKVTFYSSTETNGKRDNFSAYTDSSGKYVILSAGKEPGIPPGMYKVTVTKATSKAKTSEDMDAGQMMAAGGGGNTLTQEYESPVTTKLSATLEVGKNENVDFDIKKGKASGAIVDAVP